MLRELALHGLRCGEHYLMASLVDGFEGFRGHAFSEGHCIQHSKVTSLQRFDRQLLASDVPTIAPGFNRSAA
jgi:hypothetical protein